MLIYSVFGVCSWAVILWLALNNRRLRRRCVLLDGEVEFAWRCYEDSMSALQSRDARAKADESAITVDLDVA